MLVDLFSIAVIDKIFRETNYQLSYRDRCFYQSILCHHFSKQEENVANLSEFTLQMKDIPNHAKWMTEMYHLEQAKLIELQQDAELTNDKIVFKNVWSQHINLSRMNIQNHKRFPASDFKDEMYSSHMLFDAAGMKHKLTQAQTHALLTMFFTEQSGTQHAYTDEADCRKHFLNWIPFNKERVITKSAGQGNRILGADEK